MSAVFQGAPASGLDRQGVKLSDEVSAYIKERIDGLKTPLVIPCVKNHLCGSMVLAKFYRARLFRPVWIDDSGPAPRVDSLIRAIESVKNDGLNPKDYQLDEIKALVDKYRKAKAGGHGYPEKLADLDILMTNSLFVCASHLLSGKVEPERVNDEWNIGQRDDDLAKTLERAVENNKIEGAFDLLRPRDQGYKRLVLALKSYRDIAANGGWPSIPRGPSIKYGQSDPRVPLLRARLEISGDIDRLPGRGDGDVYGRDIEAVVERFQRRHGLDPDGVAGPHTIDAMNVPVGKRIRQIELNLERWRWLPKDLGRRYIIINIANFELNVMKDGKSVMKMKVIVGRSYRQTPVFSSMITSIIINPYWYVPHSIAIKDILPDLKKDPDYLNKKKIEIIDSGGQAVAAGQDHINWGKISGRDFNFRFRQEPGPLNALGRLKFNIPNKYDVYLHGTPAQDLFKRTQRGFSSGCIRLENPVDLAVYLLSGDPDWSRERLIGEIDSSKTETVRLKRPIPVYVLYWTAWVSDNGLLNFRDDIYGRDALLDEAFREGTPSRQ